MATERGGMFPYLKEIVTATLGVAGFEALKEAIKALGQKTGEKIGEDGARWIAYKIFGPDTEDERRFNRALTLLEPADKTRLLKKLGKLASDQSNYYRLTVMHEEVGEVARTLTTHAQLSPEDWKRLKKTMNYDRQQAEKFMAKQKRNLRKLIRGINRDIEAAGIVGWTEMLRNRAAQAAGFNPNQGGGNQP